ncbi:MAG: hypothetical protein M1353_05730 [Nitrospirae bacterium]|nr:hypothetical protein [Nitrospirota bacterium]
MFPLDQGELYVSIMAQKLEQVKDRYSVHRVERYSAKDSDPVLYNAMNAITFLGGIHGG